MSALGAGLLAGVLPVMAAAAEEAGRALPAPASATTAILATLGAVAVLFVVCALGYLYEQTRGLHWDFQRPAESADDHH